MLFQNRNRYYLLTIKIFFHLCLYFLQRCQTRLQTSQLKRFALGATSVVGVALFAISFILSGCGNSRTESIEEIPAQEIPNSIDVVQFEEDAQSESLLNLSFEASEIYCPKDFSFNSGSSHCEDLNDAVGPFPVQMVLNCRAFGGGRACENTNWAKGFARNLRGTGACPVGATRDSNTGLCIEGDFAYGPFLKAHVENCKTQGGGELACESLRWSKSLAESSLPSAQKQEKYTFPFTRAAQASYLEAPRSFGSCRDGCSRRHAGADLYGEIGRPIYAVGDGKVLDFYAFYLGTYALVVDHGEFVARYGEITSKLPQGVFVGAQIKRGQRIADVGRLNGLNINMLHFERFTGKASGGLTNRAAPYYRRSDLVNPTQDLINWKYPK